MELLATAIKDKWVQPRAGSGIVSKKKPREATCPDGVCVWCFLDLDGFKVGVTVLVLAGVLEIVKNCG